MEITLSYPARARADWERFLKTGRDQISLICKKEYPGEYRSDNLTSIAGKGMHKILLENISKHEGEEGA